MQNVRSTSASCFVWIADIMEPTLPFMSEILVTAYFKEEQPADEEPEDATPLSQPCGSQPCGLVVNGAMCNFSPL